MSPEQLNERDHYIADLLGIMCAPKDHVLTQLVAEALRRLSLAEVIALHALIYYTETH